MLWKAPKSDKEPHWDAPFGQGRPGWHLECSAMAMKQLGATLDIHCGAVDNIFPHHDNEIAQSEAVTGKPFVRFWLHGEHLLVEGEKMSKSRGNFYTLRDLLERGYEPLAIRYALLSVPYRKQLNFTFDGLGQAASALNRIKDFLFRLRAAKLEAGSVASVAAAIVSARQAFEDGLDDDLNTAQALAAVFELVRHCNIALSESAIHEEDRTAILKWFETVDSRLAIVPPQEQADNSSEIDALIAQRNQARRDRDFKTSDRIRGELTALGILIEDTKDGTRWRRK